MSSRSGGPDWGVNPRRCELTCFPTATIIQYIIGFLLGGSSATRANVAATFISAEPYLPGSR